MSMLSRSASLRFFPFRPIAHPAAVAVAIAVVRGMMMPVRMVLDASLRSITVQMRQEIPFAVVPTLADAERAHIITTLRETNWVVGGRNGAAAILGLNRTTLVARMRKLGISREKAEQSTGRSDTGAKAPLGRLSVPA
jgi:hypothetical protein